MNVFYLDASALAKRYITQLGTPVVNGLFSLVARDRLVCLTLGTIEVISVFVRKKNAGLVSSAAFAQAMNEFRAEVIDALDFAKFAAPDRLVNAAATFVEQYSLNATDAVVLRSATELAVQSRAIGNDLVLVAADKRLLQAAEAEGLFAFNPETQSETELNTLL